MRRLDEKRALFRAFILTSFCLTYFLWMLFHLSQGVFYKQPSAAYVTIDDFDAFDDVVAPRDISV